MKINKENKKKILKYWVITRKTIGWFIIGVLAFSGFLRFVELNTTCEEFNSYYEFQDTYCEKSGFLNYKISCELPQGVPIDCKCELGWFSFNVVKSSGDVISNDYNYNFNFTNNLSIA